ncbi:MAG TPA: HipA domain-containing protein [Candidatus Nanopelagicales bacterium]|nr:HipA domain-containing protein [Candidatus Nanopelagicales bacterium]
MSALEVRLGSGVVGVLHRFEDDDYRFSFDPAWLADPERSVLGQFFEDRRPSDIVTVGHPPVWFLHLLPQGPLRRSIARQHGLEQGDHFDLLRVLGEDLPGAVVVAPCEPPSPRRPRALPVPTPAEGALRFSLAGQQWKLSVREGERGLVLPLGGETGTWIAKFHDPTYADLPRVELATARWAKEAGIEVPRFLERSVSDFENIPEATPTGDGSVFLIERFDRGPGGARVHMEDFAQVLDREPGRAQYAGRYEHIAEILAYVAPQDLRAFCERLVFCVLCGNTDAHLKNWSLLYPDGRSARLSPAYDLVATVLYVPPLDDELALNLGKPGSRRFEEVSVASFQFLAEVTGRSFDEVAGWVREAAERTRTAWRELAPELPLRGEERARIDAHLARVPLGA